MSNPQIHLPPARYNDIPGEFVEEVTPDILISPVDGVVLFNVVFYGSDMVLQCIILSRAWGEWKS